MRIHYALSLLALCGMAVPAVAATQPDSTFVVAGAKLAPTPMAAWDDGGQVKGAVGKDAAKAPAKAIKYSAKIVEWPTGTVRVVTFKKGSAILHPITDETELYVLKGSVDVSVGGKTETLGAGDVASRAAGAVRGKAGKDETVLVFWNVPSLGDAPTPTVVRGEQVKEMKAPPEKPVLILKRYEFPGNSIRKAHQVKGGNNGPNSAKTDSLIYLTSGHLHFTEDGKVHDVRGGDFLREVAGLQHKWEPLEDSEFVTTSAAPKGTAPMSSGEATDHPEKR